MIEKKVCSRCKDSKPKAKFSKHKGTPDGLQYSCKECMKHTKRYTRYGITEQEYHQLYTDQEGRCYICSKHESELASSGPNSVLTVDHCHISGHVRQLLCGACNHGLGNFKDNPEFLARAVEYLKLHK